MIGSFPGTSSLNISPYKPHKCLAVWSIYLVSWPCSGFLNPIKFPKKGMPGGPGISLYVLSFVCATAGVEVNVRIDEHDSLLKSIHLLNRNIILLSKENDNIELYPDTFINNFVVAILFENLGCLEISIPPKK